MLLMADFRAGLSVQAASHRWYLPSAGGTGNTSNSPITFSPSDLASFLANSSETEFTAHFLASSTNYAVNSAIISPSLELYGQVSGAGGSNPKAWRWMNSANYGHPFDDKAYTYGYSTNWVLKSIVDVTPQGLLVGNGTKGGTTKAFLIVRQPGAN